MGLFGKRKWKENQADKIAKNKKNITPSGYINSDYVLVDISIRNMDTMLSHINAEVGNAKILGTARLLQRVSQLIIAVRIDTDDIDWDVAEKCDIKKIPVSESYEHVNDLYFIIGSISSFYSYILWCSKGKIPNNAAIAFSNWLKKMDTELFTAEQYDALGWDDFHVGIDYLTDDMIDSDMINLADQKSLSKYELDPIIVTQTHVDLRTDIMNLADYFLCTGGTSGVAFISPAKQKIYRSLVNMYNTYDSATAIPDPSVDNNSPSEDSDDDMIACEIIE